MANDREIQVGSDEFKLSIRLLEYAFPQIQDETILFYSGVGRIDHIKSLYVLTKNYLYMYDASNSVSFSDSAVFEIPVNMIKGVGFAKFTLSEVAYVALVNGQIIPLMTYTEPEKIARDLETINTIINNGYVSSALIDSSVNCVAMVLSKPLIKKDEYQNDYLSPYQFENRIGYFEKYLKKREKIIKKIKISNLYCNEKICNTYKLMEMKVEDI